MGKQTTERGKKTAEKQEEERQEEQKSLTPKQERFSELIADGLSPQEAYLAAGYSANAVNCNPYILLKKQDIKTKIASLIDKALPRIVKNDVELAKLRVHKGEHVLESGEEIPPSLIEGAKNRVYDRSSLGPVIRQSRNENLNLNADIQLTPEQEGEIDSALASYYGKKHERSAPIDVTPQS